jgi:DNA-binding YbaB/EbfC family protein
MSFMQPDDQGGFDINAILAQAAQMQQAVVAAQQLSAETELVGESGSGRVRVVVTGAMDFRSITIAPELIDPAEKELLEDLILAALRDATMRAAQFSQDALGDLGALG